MPENDNSAENAENTASVSEETEYHKEPPQNYTKYTIISILLFFALFFGYKLISGNIFRDYRMIKDGSELNEENISTLKGYTNIDFEEISSIRLERIGKSRTAVVCYRDIGDTEEFAENNILYEYGDIAEDIRVEIFPYGNGIPEYVFAESYVSIDDPGTFCYIYEYDGVNWAEFHTEKVTSEFSALFAGSEKMYT